MFFAEAMTHFLRAHTTTLCGVCLLIRDDAKLLDFEVNDTALYVQDDMEMLEWVRMALEVLSCGGSEYQLA